MSNNTYPIERLLRPPVELYAATVSGAAGLLSAASPQLWMMTQEVSWVSAGVFGWIAYKYSNDGIRVLKYQANVKRLLKYEIKPKHLPLSNIHSYIGKGFKWQARHTQRLFDTYKEENEDYLTPGSVYQLARKLEMKLENLPGLNKISDLLRSDHLFNPVRPFPDIGGTAAIHGVGTDEENEVYWALNERNGHCLWLGTTRVGKTRGAEVVVAGDINRGDNVVIVIDPKGDGDLFRRMYVEAVRAGRENEFYFFHLGYPDESCRYNPVGEYQRITEVAGKTTSQLGGEGSSAAFKAFSWRFVNVVARALVAVEIRPSIDNINRYVQDLEDLLYLYAIKSLSTEDDDPKSLIAEAAAMVKDRNPMVERKGKTKATVAIFDLMKELKPEDDLGRQLILASTYERSFYEKLVASLLPFLDKLNTDKIGKLLSPEYFNEDDERPILSWRDVIQRKGIVYIGLDGLTDKEVATAVGNAMFNDLVSIAGQIYKHGMDAGLPSLKAGKNSSMPKIFLHCDEFNSLIGDEFIPMVNQSGGAGIRINAYTQTVQDIEAKVGSKAKADQIIGNFNTLVMMRVQNIETAEILTNKLPKVQVKDSMEVSGADDVGIENGMTFGSRNQDRISEKEVPIIDPAWITSLPKGHAFVLKEGNQLWKIRLPLFNDKGDVEVPRFVTDICADMTDRYSTGDRWWLDVE